MPEAIEIRCLRAGLRSAAIAAVTLAMTTVAQAETTVRVGKVGTDFTFYPADFGMENGIFQKHGIELDIYEIGGAQIVQTMVTGNADIGLMGGTQLAYIANGVPISAVGALSNSPYGFVLIAPSASDVHSAADLKGGTISISRPKSLTEWVASNVAISQGWPVSDLSFVGVGGDAERVAATVTGEADAALVSIEVARPLVEKGDMRIVASFGELIPDFHNQIIFAANDFIEKQPDALRSFLTAWYETVQYMRDHRDEVVSAYAKDMQISEEDAAYVYDALMATDYMSLDGRFNETAIKLMDEMFVQYGQTEKPFPSDQYTNEQYLPNAM